MKFEYIVDAVRLLRPGKSIRFNRHEFERDSWRRDLPGFKPQDWVLENIVGSAYEYLYYEDFRTRDIVFERLAKPLEDERRSYVSPDRRDYYRRLPSLLYERNDKAYSRPDSAGH